MQFVFCGYYFRSSIITVAFNRDALEVTGLSIHLSGSCNEWAD